jgi:hypothetical protein
MKKLIISTFLCALSGSSSLLAQNTSIDIGAIAGFRTGQSLQLGYRFTENTHLDVVLPLQKMFLPGQQVNVFYSQLMIKKDFFLLKDKFYYSPGLGAGIGSGNSTTITLFPEYGALASLGFGVKLGTKVYLEISPLIGFNKMTPGVIDKQLNVDCQVVLRTTL